MTCQSQKALARRYIDALDHADAGNVATVLAEYLSPTCQWYGVHPFNEQVGSDAIAEVLWLPLKESFSALQRRVDIFFAGSNEFDESVWVVNMGHLMGLFDKSWLGIPATRRIAMLRYVEFLCVEGDQITRAAFHCDFINLMNQQGLHPLPPQTGASFVYPGPRTHDGLLYDQQDPEEGVKTLSVVNEMVNHLLELNDADEQRVPPEFLARTWNEDMLWYGPGGIGASYTIPRYQEQHQYPFRENLADKTFNGHIARLAEGSYAAFFGWPNLTNRPTGGFMGLPESSVAADMRVVDVYRREGSKLAENWVFIDIPHWLLQQGVDVFARMRSLLPGGH